jgi:hypothetical protein
MTIEFTWRNEDAFFLTPSVAVFADDETRYLVASFTFATMLISINK